MTKRETEPTWHLSLEQLTQLAESGASESEQEPALEHLATCRRCFGTYSELARQRIAWLGGDVSSPPEYERLARSVAQASHNQGQRSEPWYLAWVPALGLALLATIWLATSIGDDPDFVLSDPLQTRLTKAIEGASTRCLVYPGGEAGAAFERQVLRSGASEWSIGPVLDELSAEFLKGASDEATAFWLTAGYLVDGQLNNAKTFLEQALERYPDSDRLCILEAIRTYRVDSVEESIRLLEVVLERSPGDTVARFNLGYVLAEEGDLRGPELLTEVAQAAPDTPLGKRATAALTESRD